MIKSPAGLAVFTAVHNELLDESLTNRFSGDVSANTIFSHDNFTGRTRRFTNIIAQDVPTEHDSSLLHLLTHKMSIRDRVIFGDWLITDGVPEEHIVG